MFAPESPPPGPPIAPGPGVVPPFAAPPREGIRRRMWVGISVGAAVLVLCCGGGVAGLVALVASSSAARSAEAKTVVTNYMTAWQKQDFSGAYQLICSEVRGTVSQAEFSDDLGQNEVSGFEVGKPQLNTSTTVVPVQIVFADGDTENDEFGVVVDKSGDSKICDGITR
jgi:hypothetical protein